MKKHVSRILTCLGIAVVSITASSCATQKPVQEVESIPAIPRVAAPEKQTADADALIWRFIGPMTGTRGSVVLGHPTDPNVFYHGASGGLWKTPDAGQTWRRGHSHHRCHRWGISTPFRLCLYDSSGFFQCDYCIVDCDIPGDFSR